MFIHVLLLVVNKARWPVHMHHAATWTKNCSDLSQHNKKCQNYIYYLNLNNKIYYFMVEIQK